MYLTLPRPGLTDVKWTLKLVSFFNRININNNNNCQQEAVMWKQTNKTPTLHYTWTHTLTLVQRERDTHHEGGMCGGWGGGVVKRSWCEVETGRGCGYKSWVTFLRCAKVLVKCVLMESSSTLPMSSRIFSTSCFSTPELICAGKKLWTLLPV